MNSLNVLIKRQSLAEWIKKTGSKHALLGAYPCPSLGTYSFPSFLLTCKCPKETCNQGSREQQHRTLVFASATLFPEFTQPLLQPTHFLPLRGHTISFHSNKSCHYCLYFLNGLKYALYKKFTSNIKTCRLNVNGWKIYNIET